MHNSSRCIRPLLGTLPVTLFVGNKSCSSCNSLSQSSNKRQGPIVYFVRHGEAEHNVLAMNNSFALRRDIKLVDPFLTKKGISQGEAAAASLAKHLRDSRDEKPSVIVSSTLRRALRTAELVALPVAAPNASLLALDLACEIQFGDIWNEPRERKNIQIDWPSWKIEHCNFWRDCGSPPLETADEMVARAEQLWSRLFEIQSPVIVFVAHSCIFHFLMWRLSVVSDDLDVSFFENAEIRRICLPPPDGRNMTLEELVAECELVNRRLPHEDVMFWRRFSRRANAIIKSGSSNVPHWAQQEWRYSLEDSELDSIL